MKTQKHLTVILYVFLIMACMGIVFIIGRLAEPSIPESLTVESVEPETTATPSEAQEETQTEASETLAGPGETFSEAPKDTWWKDYVYKPMEEETVIEETEEPYVPPVLMIASDLHYFSAELTDGGEAFQKMIAEDDGKTTWYSDEMTDALLEEALEQKPSALILAGDITSYGEKENHLRLAEKLENLQKQGVQVLVIPGNHDINSQNASVYYGEEEIPAETVSASEFVEIYKEYGYEQAISRDENSLSYIYELDQSHWAMMLDTCQYHPVNLVNGKISAETFEWIKEQLEYAREHEIQVLPVGHHNMLKESRLYTFDCTMENYRNLTWILQQYSIPVYISGHLHAQRVKRYQEEPGIPDEVSRISEIVLTPYAIPECRYGLLAWDEEEQISFRTKAVSVSAWAKEHGSSDSNLLQFDELAPEWSRNIIKEQIKQTLNSLPEEQKELMADLYANVYYQYVKGMKMDRSQVERTEGWKLWERMESDSTYKKEIRKMLDDCQKDHSDWSFTH